MDDRPLQFNLSAVFAVTSAVCVGLAVFRFGDLSFAVFPLLASVLMLRWLATGSP